MSAKNNGGTAFPVIRDHEFPKDSEAGSPKLGMTLRDYFAAKALPHLISLCMDGDGAWSHDTVAQNAYLLADAMLAEREK